MSSRMIVETISALLGQFSQKKDTYKLFRKYYEWQSSSAAHTRFSPEAAMRYLGCLEFENEKF